MATNRHNFVPFIESSQPEGAQAEHAHSMSQTQAQDQTQDQTQSATTSTANANGNDNTNGNTNASDTTSTSAASSDSAATSGSDSSNDNSNQNQNTTSNGTTTDTSVDVSVDVSADFSLDGYEPTDNDFADFDFSQGASMGDAVFAQGNVAYDPGDDITVNDILSGALTGEGNDVGMVNVQTANLFDNDTLSDPAVSNDGTFTQGGNATGGDAKAEEGISVGSTGGDGGSDAHPGPGAEGEPAAVGGEGFDDAVVGERGHVAGW